MTIQQQIDQIKVHLDEAQTLYSHAIASNDMESISVHRKTINKYRNMVGQLIKQKMTFT